VELVVPYARSVKAPQGATVRRSLRWSGYVAELDYPWRTTVEATVLDLASRGSALDALSAVARAVQRQRTTPGLVRQELAARAGHRHGALLRSALDDVEDGVESGAEALYVSNVERAHGLPRGRRQAHTNIGRHRYHDTEYEGLGVVVEVDGRLGHEQWADRIRDGRRDRQLLTHDRVTTRLFFADVTLTPCRTALEVAAILRTRGWTGRPHRCGRRGCPVTPAL
jgi:hypothetical protein